MNIFENIIADEDFFTDIPDCIENGGSYKELFGNAFNTTSGLLVLESFSWKENDGKYEVKISVNGTSVSIPLDIASDYVDSVGMIAGLNRILKQVGYEGENVFCDLNAGVADFGIAFISREKEKELASKGMIYREM